MNSINDSINMTRVLENNETNQFKMDFNSNNEKTSLLTNIQNIRSDLTQKNEKATLKRRKAFHKIGIEIARIKFQKKSKCLAHKQVKPKFCVPMDKKLKRNKLSTNNVNNKKRPLARSNLRKNSVLFY